MARKKKASDSKPQNRPIASNRRAFYNYEILDRFEAGLVLKGTEIKSLRAGRADLRDGYARPQGGELWLVNTYIAPYDPASVLSHEPRRPRKLLLHREQIDQMRSLVAEKRLTIVPLRLYIKGHVAKVELGLARGKRQYDKRRAIKDKELDLEARRALGSAR